jgi:dipeptide/tripeptide permease
MAVAAEQTGPARKDSLFAQLARMPRAFWMVNVMEMLERLAYYGVRVVVPIYIAQADSPGGLHFTMAQKGDIYFWWALVQAGVPVVSGGFADRFGYKKTISVALAITVAGYILMGTMRSYYPFLFACCTVGLGTALFKPGLQGTLVRTLDVTTSAIGWGAFYMVVNVGGFLGPPFAHFLHSLSWPMVFAGSAVVHSCNYLMLLTYPPVSSGAAQTGGVLKVLATTGRNIIRPKLATFILVMSCFWLMFMQLFDLLPNFIEDWIDSRGVVHALHLGPAFTTTAARGVMVSQEWMINLDAGLIVVMVVWLSWVASRMKRVHSILVGMVIASVGLWVAGFSMSGWLCLLGIAVFAIGEMLASPKMNEYLGVIAPEGQKALYMGYANMPFAIGWTLASKLGAAFYGPLEKATLALRYMGAHGGVPAGVDRTTAMETMQRVTGLDANAATQLLWNTYHPYTVWVPFVTIGMVAAVGIGLYSWWVSKDVHANV